VGMKCFDAMLGEVK